MPASKMPSATRAPLKPVTSAARRAPPRPAAAPAPAPVVKRASRNSKSLKSGADTIAPPKVPPASEPAKVPKAKARLVRDSFTMPEADFALVSTLKQRALALGRPVKKSELLRAGLHALAALGDPDLHKALEALVPLKPGRPRKAV